MKSSNLNRQIKELQETHQALTDVTQHKGDTVISGNLAFKAAPKNEIVITDAYDIEIHVPQAYAKKLPLTKEVGGVVDHSYGHFLKGGFLCLGIAVEERRYFALKPTLLGYVNNLVIPYFYNYRIWATTGECPFGELAHGDAGILQHYHEALNTDSEVVIFRILLQLLESRYKAERRCPCGSGKCARNCHGDAMSLLAHYHTPATLKHDFSVVFCSLTNNTCDIGHIPTGL